MEVHVLIRGDLFCMRPIKGASAGVIPLMTEEESAEVIVGWKTSRTADAKMLNPEGLTIPKDRT